MQTKKFYPVSGCLVVVWGKKKKKAEVLEPVGIEQVSSLPCLCASISSSVKWGYYPSTSEGC